MSLINDALKRAKEAQPASRPAPEMETTMKLAPLPRTVGLPGYFMPVLLFIISGACWFLVKGWNSGSPEGTAGQPIPVMAREAAAMPAGEGAELPIPENRQFALNDSPTPAAPVVGGGAASAASTTVESSAASATAESSQPGTFKLQGIFYRPGDPSAVVNSTTVFVGDLIANARVKAIDKQSVTLDCSGEIKVLTLR